MKELLKELKHKVKSKNPPEKAIENKVSHSKKPNKIDPNLAQALASKLQINRNNDENGASKTKSKANSNMGISQIERLNAAERPAAEGLAGKASEKPFFGNGATIAKMILITEFNLRDCQATWGGPNPKKDPNYTLLHHLCAQRILSTEVIEGESTKLIRHSFGDFKAQIEKLIEAMIAANFKTKDGILNENEFVAKENYENGATPMQILCKGYKQITAFNKNQLNGKVIKENLTSEQVVDLIETLSSKGFSLTRKINGVSALAFIKNDQDITRILMDKNIINQADLDILEPTELVKFCITSADMKEKEFNVHLKEMLSIYKNIVNDIPDGTSVLEAVCLTRLENENSSKDGFIESLRLLYSHGVDFSIPTKNGKTCYEEFISKRKEPEYVELLQYLNPSFVGKLFSEKQDLTPGSSSLFEAKEIIPKSPLEQAIEAGNLEECMQLLNDSDELQAYRNQRQSQQKAIGAGALAGISTAVLSSMVIKEPPLNAGDAAIKGAVIGAAAIVAGATIWGVGRLGYECYHQYKNYDDANIGQNFRAAMNRLKDLEQRPLQGKEAVMNLLNQLETGIVTETQKSSPDLNKIGEDLVKSHLIRKALFKPLEQEAQQAIIEQSQKLIECFNKWKVIQQGRETSTGLKVVYDTITGCIPPALVALSTHILTGNNVVTLGATAVAASATTWSKRTKVKQENNQVIER